MEHEIQYIRIVDYEYPAIDYNRDRRPIGHWGMLRMHYLKNYRPILYSNLIVNGKLHDHLATLNEQARERLQTIIRQMQEAEGVTEDAKMTEPMEWVRKMNSIRNRAEEIIKVEMIYT